MSRSLTHPLVTRGLVSSVYFVLGLQLFRLTAKHAVNIFVWDQWDFNDAVLFEDHSLWEIFRWQHGPHRQGVGGLLSKALGPLLHWNSRTEAFEVAIIICMASACALYLKKRMFGTIAVSDILIPIFFLSPIHYETIFFTTNLAHGPLPLLLIMIYSLGWTIPHTTWKYATILITNFAAIYTGFGVFLGLLTPLLIAIEWYHVKGISIRHQIYALSAFVLAVASMLSFFVGYRFNPAATCFDSRPKDPMPYLWYADLLFANFAGAKGARLWPTLIGAAILFAVLLACAIAVRRSLSSSEQMERSRNVVMLALLASSVLFAANVSFGRTCFGPASAQSSHYMVYLVPAFVGLYFVALSFPMRRWRNIFIATLFVVCLRNPLHLSHRDSSEILYYSQHKRAWRECYLRERSIEKCDSEINFKIYPWAPEGTHLQQKLQYLERNHLNLYAE